MKISKKYTKKIAYNYLIDSGVKGCFIVYCFEARYYRAPTFISRDPLMNEKPWLTPYHYCSNNPVGRIDPTGCEDWEPENIDKDKNYKVILIFPTDYKDDKALSKDVKAAQKAGMPMFFVDDINDFANAMQEGLADIGSSTESYVINSHGMNGSFDIGDTEIKRKTDVSVLESGLKDKTVFLYACNVASGGDGKELLQNFSSQTSSTVIGATEELIAGYKFKGGSGLNYHGNTFKISEKGSTVNTIYDVSIHKDKGIKYKTQVPSISILKNVNY